MRRIAICISGEIRVWDNTNIGIDITPESSILQFAEHLRNKGYVVDLFGSTWDYCKKIDTSKFHSIVYNDSNKIKSWIENDFFDRFRDEFETRERIGKPNSVNKKNIFNYCGQVWNILTAFQLAGPTYDLYIRLRFDSIVTSFIEDSINIMYLPKNIICPTVNGYNINVRLVGGKLDCVVMGSDIVAMVNTMYWQHMYGSNRTITEIMSDLYMSNSDLCLFVYRIFNIHKDIKDPKDIKEENINYLSTIRKDAAMTVYDPEYSWYKRLGDELKMEISVSDGRPL